MSAGSASFPPDPNALVPEGWRAFEDLVCGFGNRHAGAPATTLLLRTQVHGNEVLEVGDPGSWNLVPGDDGFSRIDADADALVSSVPGLVVGVRTADCVPLLLVAPGRRWAAAVHAGWRGTMAGIPAEAVAVAKRRGIEAGELFAALGPSIGPCCYEVSTELAGEFARAGLAPSLEVAASSGRDRPHLDLRAANRIQLERCGLPAGNVQEVGPCTRCARERHHSFRAEPGSARRQVSWIGWEDRKPSRDRAPLR